MGNRFNLFLIAKSKIAIFKKKSEDENRLLFMFHSWFRTMAPVKSDSPWKMMQFRGMKNIDKRDRQKLYEGLNIVARQPGWKPGGFNLVRAWTGLRKIVWTQSFDEPKPRDKIYNSRRSNRFFKPSRVRLWSKYRFSKKNLIFLSKFDFFQISDINRCSFFRWIRKKPPRISEKAKKRWKNRFFEFFRFFSSWLPGHSEKGFLFVNGIFLSPGGRWAPPKTFALKK